MTEKLLRDVIKEAQEKKQLGIVIWSSWTTWENMGQGNKEVEDLAMEQIAEGKEATMNIKCGFSMPAFIAIPVEKFEAGEKYFNYVFNACKAGRYEGPIKFVPSNEFSEFF